MTLIHLPAWTAGNIAITGFQLFGATGAIGEITGENAGYSKFAHPDRKFKVPSRVGMITLYAPACLLSLYSMQYLNPKSGGNGREDLVAGLLAAHFGKRVLECAFVHKYSGTMDGDSMCLITFFYTLTSWIISYEQRQVVAYNSPWDSSMIKFGLGAFVVGQLGNFYHHVILANMRKTPKADGQKYVIPTGGLFKYVTMPHYFFELVAWLGVSCCSQQLNTWLSLLGMTSYLAGRSYATTKWYKSKFPDYPAERKNLFPFIF
eukprot:TRINITY_DN13111_c0_g1_i1.p1 TRINITY_DN13111_c0_g1~~TRINITY_DN13111_c0_g1_i1.p1  ORF type:complete len:262 (-),score=38.01 TRINITY_DN13111_c0_g1_i1:191-976(-)